MEPMTDARAGGARHAAKRGVLSFAKVLSGAAMPPNWTRPKVPNSGTVADGTRSSAACAAVDDSTYASHQITPPYFALRRTSQSRCYSLYLPSR
jgi:hypothetical protein